MRAIMLLTAFIALTIPSWGMSMRFVPEFELASNSDVIVSGVISEVQRIPGVNTWRAGLATITVDKVLKGSAEKETYSFRFPVNPPAQPGIPVIPGFGMDIKKGQEGIFFLERCREGFQLNGGPQGIRKTDEIEKFAAKIKEVPVEVSFEGKVGPFFFDQNVEVTMTIHNTGKQPVKCNGFYIQGFYFSPRMGDFVQINQWINPDIERPIVPAPMPAEMLNANAVIPDPNPNPNGVPNRAIAEEMPLADAPPLLAPGATMTKTMIYYCSKPQQWMIFCPETYLQSPVLLRAAVYVEFDNPNGKDNDIMEGNGGMTVLSSWKNAMVGYPLPDEDETVAVPDGEGNQPVDDVPDTAPPVPAVMPKVNGKLPVALPIEDIDIIEMPVTLPALPLTRPPVALPLPTPLIENITDANLQ